MTLPIGDCVIAVYAYVMAHLCLLYICFVIFLSYCRNIPLSNITQTDIIDFYLYKNIDVEA